MPQWTSHAATADFHEKGHFDFETAFNISVSPDPLCGA
jgi:hypothetical protein